MLVKPGSKEWLELRKKYIGASDVPRICGLTPPSWGSSYDLWLEKIGLKVPRENLVMQMGRMQEDEARMAFEAYLGISVFPKVVFHPLYPWLMATLDGITLEGDEIVEIKTGDKTYAMAEKHQIPDYYMLQMQIQMQVTSIEQCHYFVWQPNKPFFHMAVMRDDKQFAKVLPVLERFWECMRDQEWKFESEPVKERDDAQWLNKTLVLHDLKEKLEAMKIMYDLERSELINLAGGKPCSGNGVKLERRIVKGCIRWEEVPEELMKKLEAYRNGPKEQWHLSVGKSKTIT